MEPLPMQLLEASVTPYCVKREIPTLQLANVELDVCTLICWPAVPSKSNSPIPPTVLIDTDVEPPTDIRPVKATCDVL